MKLRRLTSQLLLTLLLAGLPIFLTSNARAMSLPPKKLKPLQAPVNVPIDLTKAGNKLEFEFEAKKNGSHLIELEYYYDDPRRSNFIEYIKNFIRSFLPIRRYTREEMDEILKDNHRVRKLVGYDELENGKWIFHPPIPTPLKIKISALDKGSEKVIFEGVKDHTGTAKFVYVYSRNFMYVGYTYNRFFMSIPLSPGLYKVEVETLKDAPELIGTKIELSITKEYVR